MKANKFNAGGMTRLGIAALGLALVTIPLSQFSASASAPDAVASANAQGAENEALLTEGRQLFNDWSCSSCHALKDAGAAAHVGPVLDGNAALTKEFVVDRVTNGAGAMPGYGGQMTEEEIATVSEYIVAVSEQ